VRRGGLPPPTFAATEAKLNISITEEGETFEGAGAALDAALDRAAVPDVDEDEIGVEVQEAGGLELTVKNLHVDALKFLPEPFHNLRLFDELRAAGAGRRGVEIELNRGRCGLGCGLVCVPHFVAPFSVPKVES
jgi:hypothetical protein